ncbi:MAG TPA: class I tRNA ligase family protein, partial [Rhizomicrobium sp.]|nr:class I tRNA ligase family protein [Rhizomicrobium sp.]
SAFYFDIRKDALYCDPASDARRRATRTVTDEVFRRIVTWFAPILCFTMEEAWVSRFPGDSVHLHDFFTTPAQWANPELIRKWSRVRELRRVVTGALELARADKSIGSSLEAAPVLVVTDAADKALFDSIDLAEIAITSTASVEVASDLAGLYAIPEIKGAAAKFAKADGEKCARCWRVLEEVVHHSETHLCDRCTDAVAALEPA